MPFEDDGEALKYRRLRDVSCIITPDFSKIICSALKSPDCLSFSPCLGFVSPSTEVGTVNTRVSFESIRRRSPQPNAAVRVKMPLTDYLNRKENMHITVSRTIPSPSTFPPRGTWCIGNAVSPKCVLAFITAVDEGEWMLWRDCDNSALCMNWKWFLLKHDHPSNVEWYICTSAACFSLDVLCDQYNRWFLFSSLPFPFFFSF